MLLDALDAFEGVPFAGETWPSFAKVAILYTAVPPAAAAIATPLDLLYVPLEPDGALAEVHFHLSRQPVFPSRLRYGLHRLKLRTAKTLPTEGPRRAASARSRFAANREILYAASQAIGAAAYFLGFDSIVAPKARWSCDNLILFTNQIGPADLAVLDWTKVNCNEWREKQSPGANG